MASQRRKIHFIEPLNASERRKTSIIENHHAPKRRNIRLVELPNVSKRPIARIWELPCVGYNKHQRKAPPTMPAPSSVPAQPANIWELKVSNPQICTSFNPQVFMTPILQNLILECPGPQIFKPSTPQTFKSAKEGPAAWAEPFIK